MLNRRCRLNNKERFALAERVQKRVQEKHPYFQLIKRRAEIEKKLEEKKRIKKAWLEYKILDILHLIVIVAMGVTNLFIFILIKRDLARERIRKFDKIFDDSSRGG